MNEYYNVNSEKAEQSKTMFACFVRTPDGMLPKGICHSKEEAIGRLVSAMEKIFDDVASVDGKETLIAYMPPDYAYGTDMGSGFKIEAVSKEVDPALTAFYADEFGGDRRYSNANMLTGYALVMEVI